MRVILVTPQRNGFAAPEVTRAIADAFVNYGKSVGVPVIDMYALGGVNDKTSSTLTLDGVHPSPLGIQQVLRASHRTRNRKPQLTTPATMYERQMRGIFDLLQAPRRDPCRPKA